MKRNAIIAALVMAASLAAACGSDSRNRTAGNVAAAAEEYAMEVDGLLAAAEELTGCEVVFDGVCTHACKHGATKIFLMGSDDTQIIRVEAAALGAFDTKCVNSVVRVSGTLREQRIDEGYLQQWEARLAADTGKRHGTGEAGCDTEKKARRETAATPAGRIADFRAKIAERQAACGKAYLSFYYVEASAYEIL